MYKIVSFIIFMLLHQAALAWDEQDISQLKTMKTCIGCDFTKADLRWANVYAAELGGAPNMVDANMERADFSGANLFGANLEGANLRGANFSGANLSWASLIAADFTGAELGGAKLTGAVFCGTIMPDGTRNNKNC